MIISRTPLFASLLISAIIAAPAQADRYEPGQVVVAYKSDPEPTVINVDSVKETIDSLKDNPNVDYAVPNLVVRGAGWQPNDPELNRLQWNFVGKNGVGAPQAWTNLINRGRPGGKGVTVAVIDSGVAYSNRPPYKRSPDFNSKQFTKGYDFIDNDRIAEDGNGHGTHVAGTIASATDNGVAVAGLAYGVKIMPIRALDNEGVGDAAGLARAIRFAAKRGAQVINLSIAFDNSTTAADIPQVIDAVNYANRHGGLVVAAAGNEGDERVSYPARIKSALAVGSTTAQGCLSEFSNRSADIDLVAPGGGLNSRIVGDRNCDRSFTGLGVYQVTFKRNSRSAFDLDPHWEGTSMAAPHVSASAALVIASGLIGRSPSPGAIRNRLTETARDLGSAGFDNIYGFGLVDAGRATNP